MLIIQSLGFQLICDFYQPLLASNRNRSNTDTAPPKQSRHQSSPYSGQEKPHLKGYYTAHLLVKFSASQELFSDSVTLLFILWIKAMTKSIHQQHFFSRTKKTTKYHDEMKMSELNK